MGVEVGGRRVIAMICGEYLSRELVAEGVADGGELLAVMAHDQMMNAAARRTLRGLQVLRSVEFGVPSVRASYRGEALLIGSDGRVLAGGKRERAGVLSWRPGEGVVRSPFDPARQPEPDIAVLYSRTSPHLQALCPAGRCSFEPLEGFSCGGRERETVILAGHGRPPRFLAGSVADLAAAVRCFQPRLVVVDACFGADRALLTALGQDGAVVVAAAAVVPTTGLHYGPAFFRSGPATQRAAAVSMPSGDLVFRGALDPLELAAAASRTASMSPDQLVGAMARRDPLQVRVPVAGKGPVLIEVDDARIRGATAAAKRQLMLLKRAKRAMKRRR